MMYSLQSDGKLMATSIKFQKSQEVQLVGKSHSSYKMATAFHVTDFDAKASSDRILIGDSTANQVHVLTLTGHYDGAHQLPSTDHLKDIATSRNSAFLYFAVDRADTAIVLRVNNSLAKTEAQSLEVFSEPKHTVVSISVTDHLMAVLVRQEDTYKLHIQNLSGIEETTMFLCKEGGGLLGVHLVDGRDKDLKKLVCDNDQEEFPSNICDKFFNTKSVDYETQLQLKITDVSKEFWVKSILTCVFSLFCILALTMFQVMVSAKHSW